MLRRFIGRANRHASGDAAAIELKHVEADVAVDNVNQPALIQHHVIALRRGSSACGLGNKEADFARC